jgi:2-polyprenyl-3-methyl-5-hydroxy-6-metoxy-1,4-benzoquinol methylase
MSSANDILSSWEANAGNWIATIENNELESRRLVTNNAITQAVLALQPKTVLDLGCGEGWLSRELRKNRIEVYGTDAIAELVELARQKDGDFYYQYSYEQIAAGEHELPSPFDLIVINFALIDKEATENLLRYLPTLLSTNGHLVIQTLHSFTLPPDDYKTGWKEGSWTGMKREFVLPYQWYFRTLQDWISLFSNAGFCLTDLKEPSHPETGKPLSFIFVLKLINS